MKLFSFVTLVATLLCVSLAGCQRHPRSYTGLAEPKDQPQYTVPIDANRQ